MPDISKAVEGIRVPGCSFCNLSHSLDWPPRPDSDVRLGVTSSTVAKVGLVGIEALVGMVGSDGVSVGVPGFSLDVADAGTVGFSGVVGSIGVVASTGGFAVVDFVGRFIGWPFASPGVSIVVVN